MSDLLIMADAKPLIKGYTPKQPSRVPESYSVREEAAAFLPSVACCLFLPSRVGEEELGDHFYSVQQVFPGN